MFGKGQLPHYLSVPIFHLPNLHGAILVLLMRLPVAQSILKSKKEKEMN